MDKLENIFMYQQKFDTELLKRRGLDNISMEEWIQKETLAMLSELAELIDEVNFKWWKNEKPVDIAKVKDELVDILHFFVSMCLKTGMDAEELYQRYLNKNKENFDRQNGQSTKKGYEV
ncbi:MAG: dUTPase [Christensenellales bacterium]|jgi:dimeric dUTPase (all-alpha-NTP-PPase superfamily)